MSYSITSVHDSVYKTLQITFMGNSTKFGRIDFK